MSEPGRIFRVRKWDDHGRNYTIGYGFPRSKRDRVAIMLCLGDYKKGEPLPEGELEHRLLQLGFERIKFDSEDPQEAEDPNSYIGSPRGVLKP